MFLSWQSCDDRDVGGDCERYALVPAPVFRPSFRGAFVGGLPGPGSLSVDGHVGGDPYETVHWGALVGLRLAPFHATRTVRAAVTLAGGMRSVSLAPSMGGYWGWGDESTHPAVGVGRLDVLFEFARESNPTSLTLRVRYETHWTHLVRSFHDGSGRDDQHAPLLASQLVDIRLGFLVCPLKPSSFFFESGLWIHSPFQPEERYQNLALIVSGGVALGGGPGR